MNQSRQFIQYLTLLVFGFLFSTHASAEDVLLNFTGTIKTAACNVSSGNGQSISLGEVSTMTFSSAGDVSHPVPFTIGLTCPENGYGQVTVTFSGNASSNPLLLALDTGHDAAAGVAVRINQQDGTPVNLNNPSAAIALVSGENMLHFTAQYQSLISRAQITTGNASATAQFTLNYQ